MYERLAECARCDIAATNPHWKSRSSSPLLRPWLTRLSAGYIWDRLAVRASDRGHRRFPDRHRHYRGPPTCHHKHRELALELSPVHWEEQPLRAPLLFGYGNKAPGWRQ